MFYPLWFAATLFGLGVMMRLENVEREPTPFHNHPHIVMVSYLALMLFLLMSRKEDQ